MGAMESDPIHHSAYRPQAPLRARLEPDERHLHTFRLRGWLYALDRPDPESANYLAHLTDRRLLLEAESGDGDVSLAWNDVIDFAQVGRSFAADAFAGVEEHMIHMETKVAAPFPEGRVFLFFAEPLEHARPADRERHGRAFIDIADELLLDAFEE